MPIALPIGLLGLAVLVIWRWRPGWLRQDFREYYSKHPGRHTPGVPVAFAPEVLRHCQLQCNADQVLYTHMPEVRHLEALLAGPAPKRVLEIGGGVGRASVYFRQRFGWSETEFWLLDGDTGDVQHSPVGGPQRDAFYNSFAATSRFTSDNGIAAGRLHLLDASTPAGKEAAAGQRFDFIYSFLAIGYHWSIALYLDDLPAFVHAETRLMFGLRGTDRGNAFARQEIACAAGHPRFRVVKALRESELYRGSVLVLAPQSVPDDAPA